MKRKKALNEAEKEAINDINAANELLSDVELPNLQIHFGCC